MYIHVYVLRICNGSSGSLATTCIPTEQGKTFRVVI